MSAMVDLLRLNVHLAHFLVAKISSRAELLLFSRRALRYGGVFLRHIYVVALAAVIKQIIADLCEVVHALPTRKSPSIQHELAPQGIAKARASVGKEDLPMSKLHQLYAQKAAPTWSGSVTLDDPGCVKTRNKITHVPYLIAVVLFCLFCLISLLLEAFR
jgi:hypothetical protein